MSRARQPVAESSTSVPVKESALAQLARVATKKINAEQSTSEKKVQPVEEPTLEKKTETVSKRVTVRKSAAVKTTQTHNTITDVPVGKKVVRKAKEAQQDETSNEKNKTYKILEGSIICRVGHVGAALPVANEIYAMTFSSTGPVGAARKAFSKIYKSFSNGKKGASSSDKPDEITYNLIVVDVRNNKHFPYLATRRRREQPLVIPKGDGVIQFNSDGTRVKSYASAQEAGNALGSETCKTIDDLKVAHPGFTWKPTGFETLYKTDVKAYKDPEQPQKVVEKRVKSEPASSNETEVNEVVQQDVVPRKKVPQAPRKPIQTAKVPETEVEELAEKVENLEVSTKPVKGRGKAKVQVEEDLETEKPPAKGRGKANVKAQVDEEQAVKPPAKGRAKSIPKAQVEEDNIVKPPAKGRGRAK